MSDVHLVTAIIWGEPPDMPESNHLLGLVGGWHAPLGSEIVALSKDDLRLTMECGEQVSTIELRRNDAVIISAQVNNLQVCCVPWIKWLTVLP